MTENINLKTRIQLKNDTLQQWTLNNPVLLKGEFAAVVDGNKSFLKVGDGSTDFNSLPYITSPNVDENITNFIILTADDFTFPEPLDIVEKSFSLTPEQILDINKENYNTLLVKTNNTQKYFNKITNTNYFITINLNTLTNTNLTSYILSWIEESTIYFKTILLPFIFDFKDITEQINIGSSITINSDSIKYLFSSECIGCKLLINNEILILNKSYVSNLETFFSTFIESEYSNETLIAHQYLKLKLTKTDTSITPVTGLLSLENIPTLKANPVTAEALLPLNSIQIGNNFYSLNNGGGVVEVISLPEVGEDEYNKHLLYLFEGSLYYITKNIDSYIYKTLQNKGEITYEEIL